MTQHNDSSTPEDNEAHFRLLVSQVRDYAIFSMDQSGSPTTWNEGVCQVLGYDRDEFIGSSVELAFLPEDVARGVPQQELETARREGVADDDRWMRRKGGEAFYATGRTTRLDDESGRCIGFSKVMRDETQRVQAEEKLRQSEERYRALFDAIDAGFCIVEMKFDATGQAVDYVFIAVNPAFERLTGLRNSLHRSILELAPDHEEHWFRTYGKVAATGTPCRFESPAASLGHRWFDVYAFRIDAPEKRHVAVLLSDITPRKRAQISSARLAALVEHSADAVLGLDFDGHVESWNPAAHVLFGYDADEIVGRSCLTLAPPEHRQQLLDVLERLRTGEAVRVEIDMACKDERVLPMLLTAGPVRDAEGAVVGFSASFLDISEQRHMQEALQAEDRRKDEFLATLAHELRNPLAPLRNGLQIARVTNRLDGALQQTVEMMDRQLNHLVRLVDDLLDVGRIRSGKIELRLRPVGVESVINASAEASRAIIAEHRHQLVVRPADQPLQVSGDPDRLAQVFSNLLSNAAKYTEPGGTIEVTLRQEGSNALVEIRDSGIGIDEADLDHVFDLFSQVRAHQNRARGGLGIGLALVRSFVTLHGGSVEVYSEGPSRGSTFQVRLPLLQSNVAAEPATTASPRFSLQVPPRRVLIADDNVDAANTLATLLRFGGHDVRVAHDGFQAVQLAREALPEIAFLDLGMPGLDGFQAARDIRALQGGEQVLLVALTGWGQESDRQRTAAAGFDRHLVKPLDPAELAALFSPQPPPYEASETFALPS